MKTTNEEFLDWLRDAHAAEKQGETMINSLLDRIEKYPELQNQLRKHLEETQQQANLVEECIKRLGSSVSNVKDAAARIIGYGQSISGVFVSDEVVKAVIAVYAFKNMEIASYTSLISAAKELDEAETQSVLEGILSQEKEMADWLLNHIPEITRIYLRGSVIKNND
jgi:ferritin-like metal-binding protein YciE